MKRAVTSFLVSSMAFALGFAAHSLSNAWLSSNQNIGPATVEQSPCSQSDGAQRSKKEPAVSQTADFPDLVDDKHITKFHGIKLDLNYDYYPTPEEIGYVLEDAKIVGLDGGDLLVNAADTLYRLDSSRRVVWKYQTAQVIFDYAYVKSSNLIYGTAGDNIMFVLDASTGKRKTGESRNGSAGFGVAANYGKDMCLVTDNFSIYRERARVMNEEGMKDGISLWRGTSKLWNIDFPPDAELVVAGNQILAVTKSKTAIYVNEIKPPVQNE